MRVPQAPAGHVTVEHRRIARRARSTPSSSTSRPLRLVFRAGLLAASLALAACQTDGSGMATSSGALAFVSIDGPPKPTFEKLVNTLSSEAESRQMKMAARDDPRAYRVKGYLSMHVERGKASVAYAWDVYDPGKDRVARITGEESAGPVKGAGGWAACDDAVLERIANRSMAELSAALGGSGGDRPAPAAATAPAPAADAPAPAAEPGGPVAALAEAAPVLAYAAN
ncbi:hypothetical protein V5F53_16755 [Xanthobacter sp. V4C-4]|uniref:hypothetical protein n=1 Tax=Xanthobacter cornucopiae TaxID=3119924 RepID=UPI0037272221